MSDEDETTLCSFHYELEKGLERFEREGKRRPDGLAAAHVAPDAGIAAIQASPRRCRTSARDGKRCSDTTPGPEGGSFSWGGRAR